MDGNFLQTDSFGEEVGRERELWSFIWWGKLVVCFHWDVRPVSSMADMNGRDAGR